MTPDVALGLTREAGMMVLILGGPMLAVGLIVGVVISVIQVVTQIQDATLSFVPKLVAVLGVLALFGGWMLAQLVAFTVGLLGNLAQYAR